MIGKPRTVGEIMNTIQDVTKVRDKIDDILNRGDDILNRSDDSLEFRIVSTLADASEYLDGYIAVLRSLKIDEA